MAKRMDRRDFFRGSASVLTAGMALYPRDSNLAAREEPQTHQPDSRPYQVKWYEFTECPDSDTCWALSVGPDGRIYAAACAEGVPGGIVTVVRYNEEKDGLDYLFSADKVTDDPADSGRATQCKIHYSFAPSMHDGILYMATHLSGPPFDEPSYSPWRSWHDEKRCFRGSALIAFDTRTDEVKWWETIIPKEGCRCLLHDEDRGLLYALSYPRDHFIIFDIKRRTQRDLGRIGSINSQALFLDKHHRVWTTNDYGHLVRYDPERNRLEMSPLALPHNPVTQTGWHSVFYDVAASPDRECVYAVTWNSNPWMMRIWPNDGDWPKVEDLGPATQDRDLSVSLHLFQDHCGGMTFAGDGQLYYVASRWRDPVYNPMPAGHKDQEGVVWRLNPSTLQREEVTRLEHPKTSAHYVTRGAVDHHGDLFFGHVGAQPSGIFKVEMPPEPKKENAHLPIRIWG